MQSHQSSERTEPGPVYQPLGKMKRETASNPKQANPVFDKEREKIIVSSIRCDEMVLSHTTQAPAAAAAMIACSHTADSDHHIEPLPHADIHSGSKKGEEARSGRRGPRRRVVLRFCHPSRQF
jgi:hypothetical protein